MKFTIVGINAFLLIFVTQLSWAQEDYRADVTPRKVAKDECPFDVCEVSVYRVISAPERFDQKKILIHGILKREFDEWVIYPNSDSARLGTHADSIQLVTLSRKSADKVVVSTPIFAREIRKAAMSYSPIFVSVVGVFSRETYGGAGLRVGSLDVTSVDPAVTIERR
jgi:hypothetical protein